VHALSSYSFNSVYRTITNTQKSHLLGGFCGKTEKIYF
jgi:hypothetical protein